MSIESGGISFYLPTPGIKDVIDQPQCSLFVRELERVADDFSARIPRVDLVDQASEVVRRLGRARIDNGGAVGGKLMNPSPSDRLRSARHDTDETVLRAGQQLIPSPFRTDFRAHGAYQFAVWAIGREVLAFTFLTAHDSSLSEYIVAEDVVPGSRVWQKY